MRIVIPGGSGQVGRILARYFHAGGHQVTVLSRHPRPEPWPVAAWDGRASGDWQAHLEGADVCINLAGRSVNCRYTAANRRGIRESRTQTTLLLNHAIAALRRPPRLWINASTATIYRHSLDRAMDEASGELGGHEPGAPDTWNFSIEVAKAFGYFQQGQVELGPADRVDRLRTVGAVGAEALAARRGCAPSARASAARGPATAHGARPGPALRGRARRWPG